MENISKQVVSIEDKKVIGYVLKPWIDFSILKKTGYIVVDEESEQEYFLKLENIISFGEVILIESSNVLEIYDFQDEFRKKVYSTSSLLVFSIMHNGGNNTHQKLLPFAFPISTTSDS